MLIFASVDELAAYKGKELGVSNWMRIDQPLIDRFAEVTGDRQWVHLDAERAQRSAFGATIAHGYLILSLIPALSEQIYRLDGIDAALNAGLNWLRFPHPVTAGSHIRVRLGVKTVQKNAAGAARIVVEASVEIKETGRTACQAEMVFLVE